MNSKLLPLLFLLLLSLVSCRKESDLVTVSFDIDGFEVIGGDGSFNLQNTSKATVADFCTRITYAVFQDGCKVKQVSQESTDADFGCLNLRLPEGRYQLLVIAHSGQQNCTVSSVEKVTFNGKCTDTFYKLDSLNVASDTVCRLELRRAVAMFRLVTTDSVPSVVSTMRFYYTGGSSTFNPSTGYGCVNSRQTELREVTSSMVGSPATFEIYTFPHQEEDTLRINIRALDGEEAVLFESTITDVPVRRNWITQQTTSFFTDANHNNAMNLSLEDNGRWSGIINIE